MPPSLRRVFAAGGLVIASGCGTGYPLGVENAKPIVLVDAERDLDCPPEDIRVEEGWGGKFEAFGCGRKASYTANCVGIRCEVHRGDQVPVPAMDRPTMDLVPR